MNITEDFCSFEVAKLLKEKGFDEPCRSAYIWNTEEYELCALFSKPLHFNREGGLEDYEDDSVPRISAPTHQMAMKWLREVHKLTFIISPQWAEGDMRNPCRWYWEIRGLDDINIDVYSNPLCNTYEEAVEAALKYSLENLI